MIQWLTTKELSPVMKKQQGGKVVKLRRDAKITEVKLVGRNVQPARNTGYSLELLESGDDDDEEEFRDTPNAIRKQSRVASEISKQSENKTSYSEQIEQYYTKTRSRVQSVISNNARARDRHVTRREFDITSELLLDTVNIRLSLYSH